MKIEIRFTLEMHPQALEEFWRAESGSKGYFGQAEVRAAAEMVRNYVRTRGEADLDQRINEIVLNTED